MNVDATPETGAQLAKGRQPGMRALDHPAVAPEPVIALDALAGDAILDASVLEVGTASRIVVALVRMQLVGPAARPARFSAHSRRESTSPSNTTQSWRLAPVTQNISGMPWRSVMMWRLLPSFPRSVGLGPVYGPPGGWPRWPHSRWRG